MDPADGSTPGIFQKFTSLLGGIELEKVGRYEFYDASCQECVRLAISTGERRTFTNMLITTGVACSPRIRGRPWALREKGTRNGQPPKKG